MSFGWMALKVQKQSVSVRALCGYGSRVDGRYLGWGWPSSDTEVGLKNMGLHCRSVPTFRDVASVELVCHVVVVLQLGVLSVIIDE